MKKLSFQILGSSSSGNCAVLRSPNCTLLIDAGFTGKKIRENLASLGLSLRDVDAVFLTHEHSDHCAGMRALGNEDHLSLFANRLTAEGVERKFSRRFSWQFFETGTTFEYCDLRVTTFPIPHDTNDPVGFVFACGDSAGTTEKLAWVTDCGKITNPVRRAVADVSALVLEANYDEKMLDSSARPADLKARIRGTHGHLSNDAAAEFLRDYENDRLERLMFAHVSRECNSCGIVGDVCVPALGSRAARAAVVDPFAVLPENAGWGFGER
ncbi:MAG: MBL fold metallo-hydrolase [Candidatus Spyradosoma sp.]